MSSQKIINKAIKLVSPKVVTALKGRFSTTQKGWYPLNRDAKLTAEGFTEGKKKVAREAGGTALRRLVTDTFRTKRATYHRATGGKSLSKDSELVESINKRIRSSEKPPEVRNLMKEWHTEQRQVALEAISRGDYAHPAYQKAGKYYDFVGSGQQQLEYPEIFKHALKKQGFIQNDRGLWYHGTKNVHGVNLRPQLARPKRTGGSSPHFDVANDDNINMVNYMLHQGRKHKMSLEDMLPWFGDDYAKVVINRIAKQNKIPFDEAKGLLLRNGGLPSAQIKDGSLFIDQVIMAKSDWTMGFAPTSMRVRPHQKNVETLVHDIWDNGSPGNPLWSAWTADSKNLVMSHSNVYNRAPSIKNLRNSQFWKNTEKNVRKAIQEPDNKSLAGRKLLESMQIHHGGNVKATTDEMLARLEMYMNYQVGFAKRNPISVMDEIQTAFSGKPDTKFIANLFDKGQLQIDVDSAKILGRLRQQAKNAGYKVKEVSPAFKDLNRKTKLKESVPKKVAQDYEEVTNYILKSKNAPRTDKDIQDFIDRRFTPALFYGSVGGLGGYGLYKSAQDE